MHHAQSINLLSINKVSSHPYMPGLCSCVTVFITEYEKLIVHFDHQVKLISAIDKLHNEHHKENL